MGRSVINETENKQTVILNDSPEGVEGGYFDSLMVWHEFGEGGGDSQFVHVTITVNKRASITLDNVLQDGDGHLVTEYPSAFNPDAKWWSIGSYETPPQQPPFQVEALAMKYLGLYTIDASTLESYEGTVKHVLLDGDIIFYADADEQTLELTFKQ